jgi:hypothetical protein
MWRWSSLYQCYKASMVPKVVREYLAVIVDVMMIDGAGGAAGGENRPLLVAGIRH